MSISAFPSPRVFPVTSAFPVVPSLSRHHRPFLLPRVYPVTPGLSRYPGPFMLPRSFLLPPTFLVTPGLSCHPDLSRHPGSDWAAFWCLSELIHCKCSDNFSISKLL